MGSGSFLFMAFSLPIQALCPLYLTPRPSFSEWGLVCQMYQHLLQSMSDMQNPRPNSRPAESESGQETQSLPL